MYLFIYVGRALNCHKNIDITDMMHSDESFPLELYKCFVCQEGETGVSGVISVTSSLHLSALHWLPLSPRNMCPVLQLSQLSQPQTCHPVQSVTDIARNGIKATHYCNMLRLLSVSLKQNYLIGTLSRQCPRPESQLLVSDCLQFRADQSCENAAAAAEMFQQCS